MRYESDFIGAVRARQHEIAASLAAGNCVNFETDQRLVGEHQGLEYALAVLNNLLREQDEHE